MCGVLVLVNPCVDGRRHPGRRDVDLREVAPSPGVRATALADSLGVEQAASCRVIVAPNLSLPGRPEVFAIGDMAALPKAALLLIGEPERHAGDGDAAKPTSSRDDSGARQPPVSQSRGRR